MSIRLHVHQAGSMSARMAQKCTSYLQSRSVLEYLDAGETSMHRGVGATDNTGLLQQERLRFGTCCALQKGSTLLYADMHAGRRA